MDKIIIYIIVVFGLLLERVKSRFLFFHNLCRKIYFFIEKPLDNNNVLVLALYEKDELREDVFELIKVYKKNNFSIFIINTSEFKQEQKNKLIPYCDIYVERNNYGQCFGSYKLALEYIYKNTDFVKIDTVTILNDSVYFLKDNLHKLVELSKSANYFGLTENRDFNYHISSYAIFISNKILISDIFKNFWKSYRPTSSRKDIIFNGEIKLSKILIDNHFEIEPYYSYKTLQKIYLYQITQLFYTNYFNEKDFLMFYKLTNSKNYKKIKYLEFFTNKFSIESEIYYNEIYKSILSSFQSGSQIHKNFLIFLFDKLPCIKLDILTRANIDKGQLLTLNKLFFNNTNFAEFEQMLLPRFNKNFSSFYKRTLYQNGII